MTADLPLEHPLERQLELELARARTLRRYARLNVGFVAAGVLYNVVMIAPFLRKSWLWNGGTHALIALLLVPALFTWIHLLRDRSREVRRLERALEDAVASRATMEGRYR